MTSLTLLTSDRRQGKSYAVGSMGLPEKVGEVGVVVSGAATAVTADSAADLLRVIQKLTPRQSLMFGTMRHGLTEATVRTERVARYGEIYRGRAHFEYKRQAGWLLLDVDEPAEGWPPHVQAAIDAAGGLRAALELLLPELAGATRLFRASSSYGVHVAGSPSTMLRSESFHCYCLLADVRLSRAVLDAMLARGWALGLSWFAVTEDGKAVERCLVDMSTAQPERIVFCSPPALGEGLARLPAPAQAIEGAAIHPELHPVEDHDAKRKAHQAISVESAQTAAEWKAKSIAQRVAAGKSEHQARAEVESLHSGWLTDLDTLTPARAVVASGGELVAAAGGSAPVAALLDYAEAELRAGRSVAIACADPVRGVGVGKAKATLVWTLGEERPSVVSHSGSRKAVWGFTRYQTEIEAKLSADDVQRARLMAAVLPIEDTPAEALLRDSELPVAAPWWGYLPPCAEALAGALTIWTCCADGYRTGVWVLRLDDRTATTYADLLSNFVLLPSRAGLATLSPALEKARALFGQADAAAGQSPIETKYPEHLQVSSSEAVHVAGSVPQALAAWKRSGAATVAAGGAWGEDALRKGTLLSASALMACEVFSSDDSALLAEVFA